MLSRRERLVIGLAVLGAVALAIISTASWIAGNVTDQDSSGSASAEGSSSSEGDVPYYEIVRDDDYTQTVRDATGSDGQFAAVEVIAQIDGSDTDAATRVSDDVEANVPTEYDVVNVVVYSQEATYQAMSEERAAATTDLVYGSDQYVDDWYSWLENY